MKLYHATVDDGYDEYARLFVGENKELVEKYAKTVYLFVYNVEEVSLVDGYKISITKLEGEK